MKKFFIFMLVLSVFAITTLGVPVVLADDQNASGDVEDFYSFVVTPSSLDFGGIPYGIAVDHMGPVVTLDATASVIEDPIDLTISVTVAETVGFYETLMQYETSTDVWEGFPGLELTVPANETSDFPTKIFGDTASFGPGSKTATLTYTLSGPTP